MFRSVEICNLAYQILSSTPTSVTKLFQFWPLADDIALLVCVGNQSHRACLCSLDSLKTKGKNEIRISAAKISEYLGIFM